jgi:hypothetical protein
MLLVSQFLFRLTFGLALALNLTNHKQVIPAFYKNHLWVTMGLMALTTVQCFAEPGLEAVKYWALAAVIASYLGSVAWIYQSPKWGRIFTAIVSACAFVGCIHTRTEVTSEMSKASVAPEMSKILSFIDPVSSGLLLGFIMGAMLLGHWYLNSPTMKMAPLERLMKLAFGATILRTIVSLSLLIIYVNSFGFPESTQLSFLALRWLAGILGVAVTLIMTWQTLKIPNTQSATGILYVGVIVSFMGELVASLLSGKLELPV